MNEEWKSVPGYENYQVSTLGSIRRQGKYAWLSLKGKVDRLGYQQVGLVKNRKQTWFLVHRLIAGVFLNHQPTSIDQFLTVNHKNRVRHDNRLSNLELVTVSDNHKHWRRHDLLQTGSHT